MAWTADDYQKQAHVFADYMGLDKGDWTYPVLGLAEEAGEVVGKFAKIVRDDSGVISEEKKLAIVKELGDVCWMVAEISTVLGVPLNTVMDNNIKKLTDRKDRNVLHGSGDNR